MTIFSDNPYDRRMEQLMMTVPNFAPRGVGFRFTEAQLFITATAATPTEILTATMRQIRCPPFRKRFNEYIESEENPMTYINEKHRTRFTLAAKNVHRENYALLSALYLLTADPRLWSCCKHHINNGCVFFENIKLNNCSERAYTLYCAAKDLTLGTKHITVSDLSDADLVPPTTTPSSSATMNTALPVRLINEEQEVRAPTKAMRKAVIPVTASTGPEKTTRSISLRLP